MWLASCSLEHVEWATVSGYSLGRNNPMHQYMLKANWVENSFAEKNLWILVDNKLAMSSSVPLWQRMLTASWAALRPSLAGQGCDPSSFSRPCILFCSPYSSQNKKNIDKLRRLGDGHQDGQGWSSCPLSRDWGTGACSACGRHSCRSP